MTTKIKFNESIVGTFANGPFSFKPGDEAEIESPLAAAWIENGTASLVGKTKPETATKNPAPETAVIKNAPTSQASPSEKQEDVKKGE